MIYLASPYSDPDERVIKSRYEWAKLATFYLLDNCESVAPYSPIVHWHEIAAQYALGKDAGFWREQNELMLARSSLLYVLTLPGWEKSKGVSHEIQVALNRGLKVQSLDIPTLQRFCNRKGIGWPR